MTHEQQKNLRVGKNKNPPARKLAFPLSKGD